MWGLRRRRDPAASGGWQVYVLVKDGAPFFTGRTSRAPATRVLEHLRSGRLEDDPAFGLRVMAGTAAGTSIAGGSLSRGHGSGEAVAPLGDGRFWELVGDRGAGSLASRLAKLAPAEIVAFDRTWEELFRRAHTWSLWGAAYVIGSGCSDDIFDYFKAHLISRGQRAYSAALEDPDTLADALADELIDNELWESAMYPAWSAYRAATGRDMPVEPQPWSLEPDGEPWTEDDLPVLLPRLASRFWGVEAVAFDDPEAASLRQLAELARAGDRLEVPRVIDHFALFEDEASARSAAGALETADFAVDPPTAHEGAYVLSFHRADALSGHSSGQFIAQILELLEPHGGHYDGWGSPIVRDQ